MDDLRATLESVAGPGSVSDSAVPRVTPSNAATCATLLHAASTHGWRIAVRGNGTWCGAGADQADFVLSTAGLSTIRDLSAANLVATVDAGLNWESFQRTLLQHGAWVALDPPGAGRTVGSVVASATAGPLQSGFGAVRDQLLGLTVVTGDGRTVSPGGRVVKNVAGFDLTRLLCGSWGAFGVITSVTFRLRAKPSEGLTLCHTGVIDDVMTAALDLMRSGLTPPALEIRREDGGNEWILLVRLLDTAAGVEAARASVRTLLPRLEVLPAAHADRLWNDGGAMTVGSVTLRVGALATQIAEAAAMVERALGPSTTSINPVAGWMRWNGDADAAALHALRAAAEQRAMPLTIERGPPSLLEQLGHWGALAAGVSPLVDRLRVTFDPGAILVAPLRAA
ncbi:MAG TPA: FAD-binding oxidoreductase [Gemmatimonadales bacterium]